MASSQTHQRDGFASTDRYLVSGKLSMMITETGQCSSDWIKDLAGSCRSSRDRDSEQHPLTGSVTMCGGARVAASVSGRLMSQILLLRAQEADSKFLDPEVTVLFMRNKTLSDIQDVSWACLLVHLLMLQMRKQKSRESLG